eukprot:GABV01012083.1.p1 GENE.GABV01012083.1~~GABV01012083.1.p1  ORF type:complete len:120 (-),score=12.66 GABV01012083.1:3-362(-)
MASPADAGTPDMFSFVSNLWKAHCDPNADVDWPFEFYSVDATVVRCGHELEKGQISPEDIPDVPLGHFLGLEDPFPSRFDLHSVQSSVSLISSESYFNSRSRFFTLPKSPRALDLPLDA